MYATGNGVKANLANAYFWFSLAAAQNNPTAIENLAIVEKQITPKQRMEAQAMLKKWKP
jgi:TPR repeat protein